MEGADKPSVGTEVPTEKDRGRSCFAKDPQEHFTGLSAEVTRAEKFNPQSHWYRKTGMATS